MPQPYNLTNLTSNTGNLYTLIGEANNLAGGWISFGFIITLFLILFMGFKAYSTKRAFAGASFITAITAMLFRVLTWTNDTVMFGSFILAALSLVWLRWGD